MRGEAEAAALRAKGLAEAESLKAKGLAEAEALQRKIEVLNDQNQSAILDKALTNLPELAEKMFEAYAKIGNVTYVATGEGDTVTSRVSRDIVGMLPMLGAMFESTTGLNLRDMIQNSKPGGNGSVYTVEGDGAPPPPMSEMAETPVSATASDGDGVEPAEPALESPATA
jgi:flotillin